MTRMILFNFDPFSFYFLTNFRVFFFSFPVHGKVSKIRVNEFSQVYFSNFE